MSDKIDRKINNLEECAACGEMISNTAPSCPHCGDQRRVAFDVEHAYSLQRTQVMKEVKEEIRTSYQYRLAWAGAIVAVLGVVAVPLFLVQYVATKVVDQVREEISQEVTAHISDSKRSVEAAFSPMLNQAMENSYQSKRMSDDAMKMIGEARSILEVVRSDNEGISEKIDSINQRILETRASFDEIDATVRGADIKQRIIDIERLVALHDIATSNTEEGKDLIDAISERVEASFVGIGYRIHLRPGGYSDDGNERLKERLGFSGFKVTWHHGERMGANTPTLEYPKDIDTKVKDWLLTQLENSYGTYHGFSIIENDKLSNEIYLELPGMQGGGGGGGL